MTGTNKNELVTKNIPDGVLKRVNEFVEAGELVLPRNYHVGNAIKEAWLIFSQDKKLLSCTKESIQQSLLDMSLMGLSPAKKQVYFVTYGSKATAMPSYFGKQQALRRIDGIKDIVSDVIYKDTKYELIVNDYGEETIQIVKPCPLDKRKKENIIAAWATVILDEDIFMRDKYTTIMTIDEIRQAWNQGYTKGNSPAHKNFPQEMAKKSVINRCVKNFINTFEGETNQNKIIEALHRTTEAEYEVVKNDKQVYEDKIISFEEEATEVYEEAIEAELVEPENKVSEEKGSLKGNYEDLELDLEY